MLKDAATLPTSLHTTTTTLAVVSSMGRKLDALLRRRASRTAKLKVLLSLTVSRIAILKNRRNICSSQASDDIVVLLQNGHRDRAILRAGYVIKEQDMVDAFVMVEGYCDLLMERSTLLEYNSRECPSELKEAIASLVFVASRSGELLELHDVRSIFTSWYGSELAKAAVELRGGCGVNLKIVQQMPTKQVDLESKLKVVKDIATKNGLSFDLEDILPQPSPANPATGQDEVTPKQSIDKVKEKEEEENPSSPKQRPAVSPTASRQSAPDLEEDVNVESTNSSTKQLREKWLFTDATSAAQAAFESATCAAAAARAAIELSRRGSSGSHSGATQQAGGGLHHLRTAISGSEMEREAIEEEGATSDHDVPPPMPQGKEANEEEIVGSELDPDRRRSGGEDHTMQKPYSVRTRRGRS